MNLPQPLWDRVVRYVGLEQKLIKIKQRDWRFEEARAYLNRVHHLYMCIRTQPQGRRSVRMRRLQEVLRLFEKKHLKKDLRFRILMGQVHRKMCCTDRRRQRYVELYVLYNHLRRFIKKPHLAYYPYIEYQPEEIMQIMARSF